MSVLQKTRILANQRLDLNDFNRLSEFNCADWQAHHRYTLSDRNVVVQGLEATGTGTSELTVPVAGSSVIYGQNNGQFFIGSPSLDDLKTSNLTPNSTNYIELLIETNTGGADSRAFWDQTANGGDGAEFSQTIDTFSFLDPQLSISSSSFSGESNKIPVCEVDVNSSGVITAIRDSRNLMFRLGQRGDAEHDFPWVTKTEPSSTSFTGADKDINTLKDALDAIMTEIKSVKGTTYWYEDPTISLIGSFRNTGLSLLVSNSSAVNPRFSWDGTELSITDDAGSPTDSDIVAYLRSFDQTDDLALTRQDSAEAIAIGDGEILWVEIPSPYSSVSYDDVGITSSNYRVSARGAVPNDDSVYWLAYREGTRLYLRGLGELEANESRQINDETTQTLSTLLGFDPETASSVPYSATPDTSYFPNDFNTNDPLADSISTNTKNINFIGDVLDTNAYQENLVPVTGVALNDNEVSLPVNSGDILTLPFDSRDGNSTEAYVVGRGLLELYLNGQLLLPSIDYNEVGTSGSASTQVEWLRTDGLDESDIITFRIDTTGGFSLGGGGGTTSLQDAYNVSSNILVSSGNPVTIQGPSGEKLLRVIGDIEVTGVVDPAALQLTRQSSNPLAAGQEGIYIDSSGNLMQSVDGSPDLDITATASGQSTSVGNQISLTNNSGSSIAAYTIVSSDSNGDIQVTDITSETNALSALGITKSSISDSSSGAVLTDGLIKNITTSATFGPVWLDRNGDLTNSKPSIGVSGFQAGDVLLLVGVITKNQDNPSNKDLVVKIQNQGVL